ncbi:MAG: hypothetical protein EZS28_044666, partial [Streblomastix strix]
LRGHEETKSEMHLRLAETLRALLRIAQRQRERGATRALRMHNYLEEQLFPLAQEHQDLVKIKQQRCKQLCWKPRKYKY